MERKQNVLSSGIRWSSVLDFLSVYLTIFYPIQSEKKTGHEQKVKCTLFEKTEKFSCHPQIQSHLCGLGTRGSERLLGGEVVLERTDGRGINRLYQC